MIGVLHFSTAVWLHPAKEILVEWTAEFEGFIMRAEPSCAYAVSKRRRFR